MTLGEKPKLSMFHDLLRYSVGHVTQRPCRLRLAEIRRAVAGIPYDDHEGYPHCYPNSPHNQRNRPL
jgi:hypothetical protein